MIEGNPYSRYATTIPARIPQTHSLVHNIFPSCFCWDILKSYCELFWRRHKSTKSVTTGTAVLPESPGSQIQCVPFHGFVMRLWISVVPWQWNSTGYYLNTEADFWGCCLSAIVDTTCRDKNSQRLHFAVMVKRTALYTRFAHCPKVQSVLTKHMICSSDKLAGTNECRQRLLSTGGSSTVCQQTIQQAKALLGANRSMVQS